MALFADVVSRWPQTLLKVNFANSKLKNDKAKHSNNICSFCF